MHALGLLRPAWFITRILIFFTLIHWKIIVILFLLEAERARMAPIADRRGVRATAACAVMAIVLVVMLSMFLYGRGQIAAQNAKVTRLESRIAKADEDYAALESSYEYLMSHTNVGMVAVQQGMVSSQGRASIKIRVPENMAVTPCVTTETVTADSSK